MQTANEEMSISAIRQSIATGTRTLEEVLASVRERIAACDRGGVWITLADDDHLRAQMTHLYDARRAGRDLPLWGAPFAVKDNIDVAGLPTTAACPAYSYMPQRSATSVQKLIDAGAICVGKTNLDQFATGLVGTRSPYGACENAHDRKWISGGSSSGSAVAVAAGLVPFSLGTDTAGSGRVPAAFNNIVGLKPTRGLISAAGVVPACRSLDCVSIFATTCEDAQVVLRIASGPDPGDALSRTAPPESAQAPGPLRIGIPAAEQLQFFGNSAMAHLFQQAVKRVRALGHSVVPVDFAPFRAAGDMLYGGPWVAERLVAAGKIVRENPDALRPEIRTILQGALRFTATDAFEAQYQLAALRRQAETQWARMDVLLAPTTGTIYRIAEVEANPMELNRNLSYYTTFVNLFDLSAVAVPCGFLPGGLPMGVTFMGRAFEESRLLAIGSEFHAAVSKESASC